MKLTDELKDLFELAWEKDSILTETLILRMAQKLPSYIYDDYPSVLGEYEFASSHSYENPFKNELFDFLFTLRAKNIR